MHIQSLPLTRTSRMRSTIYSRRRWKSTLCMMTSQARPYTLTLTQTECGRRAAAGAHLEDAVLDLQQAPLEVDALHDERAALRLQLGPLRVDDHACRPGAGRPREGAGDRRARASRGYSLHALLVGLTARGLCCARLACMQGVLRQVSVTSWDAYYALNDEQQTEAALAPGAGVAQGARAGRAPSSWSARPGGVSVKLSSVTAAATSGR